MAAALIDGKAVAAEVRAEVAEGVAEFTARHGRQPGLATVLVGDDPASHVYVGSKRKLSEEVGMRSIHHRLDAGRPPGSCWSWSISSAPMTRWTGSWSSFRCPITTTRTR